jgi:hypothetical protein
MYLMRSSTILYQILSTALSYKLKKKDEQTFMYEQLQLLDRQYCLEMEQQLWQSYFDVGLKYQIWPVSILLFSFDATILIHLFIS